MDPTDTRSPHTVKIQRQRVRRANSLVATAKAVVKGERRCTATSKVRDADDNVVYGEDGKALRRPCGHYAIKGGTVCYNHGGSAPKVKAAAQRRLAAMVEPAIVRLNALVHQDEHLPTALGAIRTILERADGEAIGVLKKQAEEHSSLPTIVFGIKVGGIATPTVTMEMRPKGLPAGDDDDTVEGDLVDDDSD